MVSLSWALLVVLVYFGRCNVCYDDWESPAYFRRGLVLACHGTPYWGAGVLLKLAGGMWGQVIRSDRFL